MKLRRIFSLVKLEMTRQFLDPLVLVFTTFLVPLLILIFGFALGNNYGWGPEYTIFEIMLPGFLAYAGLLTIYDVAAGVGAERETGIQNRINTTPLTTAEYLFSQMISYAIKPIIQLALGLGLAVAVGYRPLIFFGTTYSIGAKIAGCLFVIAFMIVFSFSSVGLGLITASIVNTANAAAGLSFAWIVPQQIFGSFIPPAIFGMDFLGWIFPSWYATRGIGLLFGGVSFYFWELWVRFGALLGFTILIYILGIFLYERKKRR
ncbi:MAG: ABC transporter permease [Asgard group archaeon]|nr:ABC transporter permease [Asgard group archaeon]